MADGLVARGAVLLDADRIVRELQQPGKPVFEAMVQRWGSSVVSSNGTLDRAAVAELVFNDETELAALNAIVHPAVGAEMAERRDAVAAGAVVVLDIPLLVRADGQRMAERYRNLAGIIVVDADPAVAVQRLVDRRGFSADDARARISNQADRASRMAVADFVIDNNGTFEDLEPQIDACWKWACSLG